MISSINFYRIRVGRYYRGFPPARVARELGTNHFYGFKQINILSRILKTPRTTTLEIVCINLWFFPHLSSCCSTFSPFFHLVWICRCCFLSFFTNLWKMLLESFSKLLLKKFAKANFGKKRQNKEICNHSPSN